MGRSLALLHVALPAVAALSTSLGVRVTPARTGEDLCQAAEAFAMAFWGDEVSESLRSELVRQHQRDMAERYGELVGARRLSSQLLVARDESGGIVGLVGCELAVVDVPNSLVLSRRRGEAIFNDALAAMGGRQRNELRKAPLPVLAEALLPFGARVLPVLSNLAVLPAGRRKGLGRTLCTEVEAVARGWAEREGQSQQLLLQVEARNEPARALYSSLGFGELWTHTDAVASRIVDGALTSGTTTLITMAKDV
jgi:ribosomal protein S18 acetylase RimI-like enzyme